MSIVHLQRRILPFLYRLQSVYKEIPNATLASFSTLKYISSQNFIKFRQYFKAEYKGGFICNANSFDNVKGKFPIGFLIWDLSNKKNIGTVETDILLHNNTVTKCQQGGVKLFYAFGTKDFISSWLREYYDTENEKIAYLILPGVDMQCQNGVYITAKPTASDVLQHKLTGITKTNLRQMVIYLAVRQVIKPHWTNNRDQFLYPHDHWKTDNEFKNDCLALALFEGQNKISAAQGINHWIPFTAEEVNAGEQFESTFMTDFIKGKIKKPPTNTMFVEEPPMEYGKIVFSDEANAVFEAGKALWKHYHTTINNMPTAEKSKLLGNFELKQVTSAALYDIRAFFQGRTESGKMQSNSNDDTYNVLMQNLRDNLEILAEKIIPKVYEYGFLKP